MSERIERQAPERYAPGVTRTLEHPLPPPEGRYRWVYLWHWPIRAMHWAAAAAIVLLIITGLSLGRPYFVQTGEASSHFVVGRLRFLHFAAAGVLVATGIVRAYWLFAGNRFERWRALFPLRGRDWANLWRMIKYYLLIRPEKAPHYLGHNPLQQIFYTLTYLVTLTMIVTGFTLYGQSNPAGMIFRAMTWVPDLVGGLQMVRVIHHTFTWFFTIFIPIHVYLAIRSDLMERTGTMSSIVSGGRFVPTDRTYVDG